MPFVIKLLRTGPTEELDRRSLSAMSPDRCGPGPSSAIARMYVFSAGVRRSKRTLKKLSSSAAIASFDAPITSASVIGVAAAMSQECLPHS